MNVNIKNLTKTYHNVFAVNELSLNVEDGKLVCILGPSGCGKSTLLYMLAGILEPTSGYIYFDHNRVNKVPIEHRNIGLVFQNYSLYPHMTVLENLIFPLRMKGMKKKEAINEGKEISKLLKIEDLLKRKPKELSGGQQQRVAIGRALIKKPDLLLMDEPFSNLDAALRVEMREEIKSLQKNFKITTLFVTHDQEEALSISDKILLMNKGEAVQYDDPKKIYQEPNSIYSGDFIGNPKINIINNIDNEQAIQNIVSKENLHINNPIKAIGIRPEDIVIINEISKNNNILKDIIKVSTNNNDILGHINEGSTNHNNILKGNIVDVQCLGRDTHFKVKIQDLILRGVLSGSSSLKEGQVVNFYFKKVHVFER